MVICWTGQVIVPLSEEVFRAGGMSYRGLVVGRPERSRVDNLNVVLLFLQRAQSVCLHSEMEEEEVRAIERGGKVNQSHTRAHKSSG